MRISFDLKWFVGIVIAVAVAIFTYKLMEIANKEYDLKIEPILSVNFDIVGSDKCDLVVANVGTIAIKDIRINLWPRLVMGPTYEVISSTSGKFPWKTIRKLGPEGKVKYSLDEEFLRTRVRNQILFYRDRIDNSLFPVLLVYITYRRPADNKLYNKQKYLFVAEDAKSKKIMPFDLDENHHQAFVDLRERLKAWDKERVGSLK